MVEYRYAMIRRGRTGYPVVPSPPMSAQRCLDLIRAACPGPEAIRVRCHYGPWLPTGFLPFPPDYPVALSGWQFCPVWGDDEVIAILLKKEYLCEDDD